MEIDLVVEVHSGERVYPARLGFYPTSNIGLLQTSLCVVFYYVSSLFAQELSGSLHCTCRFKYRKRTR